MKPTSSKAMVNLRNRNINKIGLLTGDTKNIAERVGKEGYAGALDLPRQK